MNPYYDYEKAGLEMIEFNEPDMCYEFNTLCFWATKDGRIYSASDSGCSCPTPFESYAALNVEPMLAKLERVGSIEQAERIFDAWNTNYKGKKLLPPDEKHRMVLWIKERVK